MQDTLSNMSLAELLDLREEISRVLMRRFQQKVALVFTDVVGSTAYFERHGDAAGKALVQRHHQLLEGAMEGTDGWVVDTAGDGAFCVFSDVDVAAQVLIDFQLAIDQANTQLPRKQWLSVRTGLHWGPALVDGESVSGDAVNYAARVSSVATGGQILASPAALLRLPPTLRFRCIPQPPQALKGVSGEVELSLLMWLDPRLFPGQVVNRETEETIDVPLREKVRFGRLEIFQGSSANEVVLRHPDPDQSRYISRWHFELERTPLGFRLHQLSTTSVEVDGTEVSKGETALLRPDSVVVVAGVLALEFKPISQSHGDETYIPGG